jgi:hypothetical protein
VRFSGTSTGVAAKHMSPKCHIASIQEERQTQALVPQRSFTWLGLGSLLSEVEVCPR